MLSWTSFGHIWLVRTHTHYRISRELATTVLIFETRRNINETRDRRSNPREKGPSSCIIAPSFPSIFRSFFRSLPRADFASQAFRSRSVRDRRPHRAVGRARAPVITLREGEYGYRGPGLKPRVSPIVRRRRVFTVHNSAECISNACQCQDRNADVVRRFAPFRTRGPPRRGRGPSARRGTAVAAVGNPGITRRHFGARRDLRSSYATRKLVTHDCPVIYALSIGRMDRAPALLECLKRARGRDGQYVRLDGCNYDGVLRSS